MEFKFIISSQSGSDSEESRSTDSSSSSVETEICSDSDDGAFKSKSQTAISKVNFLFIKKKPERHYSIPFSCGLIFDNKQLFLNRCFGQLPVDQVHAIKKNLHLRVTLQKTILQNMPALSSTWMYPIST